MVELAMKTCLLAWLQRLCERGNALRKASRGFCCTTRSTEHEALNIISELRSRMLQTASMKQITQHKQIWQIVAHVHIACCQETQVVFGPECLMTESTSNKPRMASINVVLCHNDWLNIHSFKTTLHPPASQHLLAFIYIPQGAGQFWQTESYKMMGEIGKNMSFLFCFFETWQFCPFHREHRFPGCDFKVWNQHKHFGTSCAG